MVNGASFSCLGGGLQAYSQSVERPFFLLGYAMFGSCLREAMRARLVSALLGLLARERHARVFRLVRASERVDASRILRCEPATRPLLPGPSHHQPCVRCLVVG